MTHVLAAGITVLDCIFRVDTIPVSAEKHTASELQWVVGGCAANAAIAMARLGGQVMLASEVGEDIAGDMIISRLQEQAIDLSLVTRLSHARTPCSSVAIDAAGERQIVNFRGDVLKGSDALLHSAVEHQAARRLRAVLADTRWPAGAQAALELAAGLGIPGILDAEPPLSLDLLQRASHVAFSHAGLLSLSRSAEQPASLEAALLQAQAQLPGHVCVTDGARGVYAVENGGVRHYPAYAVTALDTLGAGDVWHGAFCLRLATGHNEAQSIRFANAAAALKCTRTGGGDAAPDLASVEAFMQHNRLDPVLL